MTRSEAIAEVAARWVSCMGCPLTGGCRQVVPGEIWGEIGAQGPIVLIVTDPPTQHEDAAGRMAAGPAADLLRSKILQPIDFPAVLVLPVVACRPPGNRAPTPQEIAACAPRIAEMVAAAGPIGAVLTVGKFADLTVGKGIVGADGVNLIAKIPIANIVAPAQLIRQGHPSPATDKQIMVAKAKALRLLQRAKMADLDPVVATGCLKHDPVRVGSEQLPNGLTVELTACRKCAIWLEG